jgi:hypothetical protein
MKTKTTLLTASEGADRVAECLGRGRASRRRSKWTYTCEGCHHHEFLVDVEYQAQAITDWAVPCSCGCYTRAAIGRWIDYLTIEEEFILREDHRLEPQRREIVKRHREDESDIECKKCFATADENDYDQEVLEETEGDRYYRVRCGCCGREIEFGWTGWLPGDEAIYPVEASDFEPEHVRADAKYEDAWRERGW